MQSNIFPGAILFLHLSRHARTRKELGFIGGFSTRTPKNVNKLTMTIDRTMHAQNRRPIIHTQLYSIYYQNSSLKTFSQSEKDNDLVLSSGGPFAKLCELQIGSGKTDSFSSTIPPSQLRFSRNFLSFPRRMSGLYLN